MKIALRAILIGCLALPVGCRMVEPGSASKSPLAPIAASPDAITLEIFSAPLHGGDEQLEELWQLVDEQPLPADLRRRLDENGFRVGLIGPSVPTPLAEVLKISEHAPDKDDEFTVALNPEADVNLRVLHAKAGKRVELAIPEIREQMHLLESIDSEVGGKTYRKAECRLALRAQYADDGRVRVEVTPEVHHGEFQSRVRGNDGMMMFTQERPKRVFEELQLQPTLAPGQMLVLAGRISRRGSAGYHFFHDTRGDAPLPMLWVIRVARDTHDTAFFEPPETDGLPSVSNDIEQ